MLAVSSSSRALPTDAQVKDALIGLMTRVEGCYKYIAQASQEQLTSQMRLLLNEHADNPIRFDTIASTLVQNLKHLSVGDIPSTYLKACTTAFSDHPILLINKCMQFYDQNSRTQLRNLDKNRGMELMSSLHANRDYLKGKIRLFHTKESISRLELSKFLPYLITLINFSLDTDPKSCKEILEAVLEGVNEQFDRFSSMQCLSPQLSSRLFQMLSLYKHDEVKGLNHYQSVLRKLLNLSGVLDPRLSNPKGDVIVEAFSHHFYWFRVYSERLIDMKSDPLHPFLIKHAVQSRFTAEALIKSYPNAFVAKDDDQVKKLLNRYYHGLSHLKRFGQVMPDSLERFLTNDISSTTGRISPIEQTIIPKLRDEVACLFKQYPSSSYVFESNVTVHGYELDVMLTIQSPGQKRIVNIELDSVTYHSEPMDLLKDETRDGDLKAKKVEVIRLMVGDMDATDLSEVLQQVEALLKNHTTHLKTTQWNATLPMIAPSAPAETSSTRIVLDI
jgi:hypothetical protein